MEAAAPALVGAPVAPGRPFGPGRKMGTTRALQRRKLQAQHMPLERPFSKLFNDARLAHDNRKLLILPTNTYFKMAFFLEP